MVAQVTGDQLSQDVAEIGGQCQVAAFVELFLFQAGPSAVNLAAFDAAPDYEHAVGMAVVGTAVTVFARRAAELRHGDYNHIRHAIAHIPPESVERGAVFAEKVGKRPIARSLAAFVD